MTAQAALPLALPRSRPRRVMMQVADAGVDPGWLRYECLRCGYDTGWTEDPRTLTEQRRGKPCPRCNSAKARP